MQSIINFSNAIATLKDGATINEEVLRETKVYAKLMLQAGMRFENVKSTKDFILSDKETHIRAELFVINKNDTMIIDNRLWVNVNVNAVIMRDDTTRMFFVELIHTTVNLSNVVIAFSLKGGK